MSVNKKKIAARLRRKHSIRKRLSGTPERPRLSVFRSTQHMYAQVVDDTTGATLVTASTLSAEIRGESEGKKKSEQAKMVGMLIAARCRDRNIGAVVFDRNGFIYHGRVKAVADGAREGGLNF